MEITVDLLTKLREKYGNSFYILDSKQFERNYHELICAFRKFYPNSHIAYSYKTNYTPALCKTIDRLGGFAEVVSDMEYRIAIKAGVAPRNIFFNGPYKTYAAIEETLSHGGIVNVDAAYELDLVKKIAASNHNKQLKIGLRCNFDIGDGVTSRFGFDVNSPDFKNTINEISKISNLKLAGFHCHFATRSLETWPPRAEGMLQLIRQYFTTPPEFITLGGGLFGKMGESLKAQFDSKIPEYHEYAEAVAAKVANFYSSLPESDKPKLIIEPGSALAGDAMKFAATVINIKDVRGKKIATVSGSIYNINPTLNKKNPPITVYHDPQALNTAEFFTNLDFGGYTCIESDYLYRGFSGNLAVGDMVVFENAGSYSVVLKPPFILPNFPILDLGSESEPLKIVKKQETFEDLFKTFEF